MANDFDGVRAALARAVAGRQISDDAIGVAAKQITAVKHKIHGLDVCAYGICIDYFIGDKEWWRILPELIQVDGGQVKGIEIFPWGIPWPDILHVRVTHSFDAIPEAHI